MILLALSAVFDLLHLALRIYTLSIFLLPFWPLILRSLCWYLTSCMLNLGVAQVGFGIFFFYLRLCILFREGNGTPLQYSCLENPMDGGAW